MKPVEPIDQDDDLRPSYDLNSLRVRRLGEGRKSFAISYGSIRTRCCRNVSECRCSE